MYTSRDWFWLPLLVWIALGPSLVLPGAAGAKDRSLARDMKRSIVAVVPPANVHIRGESKAHIKHRPLEGYDSRTYAELFAGVAEKILGKGATGWDVRLVHPDEKFYRAVETSDPDADPASALPSIPAEAEGCEYAAVIRYAEFAYSVEQHPRWSRNGQMVMVNMVVLALDLQLVVFEGASGAPLETFDAQYEVQVPEIQAKPIKAKAFHRATRGALLRLRTAVARGETVQTE